MEEREFEFCYGGGIGFVVLLFVALTLGSCSSELANKSVGSTATSSGPSVETPLPPPPAPQSQQPSGGSGGEIANGTYGDTPEGGKIYLPTSYNPEKGPSRVVVLFNMSLTSWRDVADEENIIIVGTISYNDVELIFQRMEEALAILTSDYNIDLARIYIGGWSAGGNIALIYATTEEFQSRIAGVMVFPGSGGDYVIKNFLTTSKNPEARKMAIYYAIGTEDTGTGYYPVAGQEARVLQKITGYENRVKIRIWEGEGHKLPNQAMAEAWNWIRDFNTLNN